MNQQSPIMQVAMHVNDLLDEDEDFDKGKAFYSAREKFDNLPGMDKSQFFELFQQVKAKHHIPLLAAGRKLAKAEDELVASCIEQIQAKGDTDPKETRELLELCGSLDKNAMSCIERVFHYVDDDTWEEVLRLFPERVQRVQKG